MASTPKVLAFSGSLRKGSYNKLMVKAAMEGAKKAGAQVTYIDLAEYPLPIFDEDLETQIGLHPNAAKLKALLKEHDAFLISSPEYNSSISAALKNTIDWLSRADDNPFTGKIAAVVSASPGQFGGVRSMQHARHLLLHLGCHVVPAQCMLPKAHEAFDEQGQLKSPRALESVKALAQQLVDTTRKLA